MPKYYQERDLPVAPGLAPIIPMMPEGPICRSHAACAGISGVMRKTDTTARLAELRKGLRLSAIRTC